MDNQGPWTHLAMAAITLAGVAAVMWVEAPEYQRELARRAVRLRLWRIAAVAARSSGHRAMGDELSGRDREALAGYRFTYKLSRLRDRL
jgi:hypothetical protein